MIQLHSQQVGPTYAPRWVVRTNKDFFWNGENWTPYRGQALLFHVVEEADYVVNDLMTALFESMPVWKYKAYVEIQVFGFIQPTLGDLKDHLWETQSLDVNFADSGPEASIVLCLVEWDTLKEERP